MSRTVGQTATWIASPDWCIARRIPFRGAGTEIEPGRVARKPGLAERHQPGATLCRAADEIDRLVDRRLEVEEDRRRLHRRDAHRAVAGALACRGLPGHGPAGSMPAQRIDRTRWSNPPRPAAIVCRGPAQRKNQLASPPAAMAPSIMYPDRGGDAGPPNYI